MLCDYIIYRGEDFRNKTVVDLGSGTGLTSVVAALFAGSVYCTGTVKLLNFCMLKDFAGIIMNLNLYLIE